MDNRSARIIVCWWVAVSDSGLESEYAKFYWLQLQLQLRSKRLWSTLTDSNSSLDYDSAALLVTSLSFLFP